MIHVTNTNILSPIEFGSHSQLSGMSEDIADVLIQSLKGFSAWIELFALMPDPIFETAALELTRLKEHFNQCQLRLMDLKQRLRQPNDIAIVLEMDRILDKLFRQDIAKETICELMGSGWTSWGEKIISNQPFAWTPDIIEQLLTQVAQLSWKNVQELFIKAEEDLQHLSRSRK